MDNITGLSLNHVFVQKSRWPYSMQSKFGMDKIQGSYKVGVVICIVPCQDIFSHHQKKGNGLPVGCRLILLTNIIMYQ